MNNHYNNNDDDRDGDDDDNVIVSLKFLSKPISIISVLFYLLI